MLTRSPGFFRYIQEELLDHQRGKADADIKLRKAMIKGIKKDEK